MHAGIKPVLANFAVSATMLFALLFLAGCQRSLIGDTHVGQGPNVYPRTAWRKVETPEQIGWSSARLDQARAFSQEIGSTAIMIVQGGVVVSAWGEVATKSNLHSVRKSLLSGLIGIFVDRGGIDLSRSLASLGIDDNPPSLTETENQATVGDLLKARSGIYHAALYETPQMTASKPPRGSHPPGSYWHYNNWDFNTLGTIFEQETGEKIFEAFKRHIADPLQMQDYQVDDGRYVTGLASIHPAYPFRMTARDLARFGLLFLRHGRWQQRQIISADWVAESTARHSDLGGAKGYGYMWWTAKGQGFHQNLRLKERVYYADGYGGQYAFIFPYLDLIVVHRVNTDGAFTTRHSKAQMGRLLWLILSASGETGLGPDPAIEAASGERLDQEALRHVLTGATVTGRNKKGHPWQITFAANGRLVGLSGQHNEDTDRGRWWLKDGWYCREWTKWAGGRKSCHSIVMEGQQLKLFDTTGTYLGRGTLKTQVDG